MFDYAILGGTVADGSGSAPVKTNVYVQDGRIAAVTQDILPAAEILDATDHWVTPGFIDIHTHSDKQAFLSPGFEGTLAQGVTTHLMGNCGSSAVPSARNRPESPPEGREPLFAARDWKNFAAEVQAQGIAINLAALIGHANLRKCCMADPDAVEPAKGELDAMCTLLEQEMRNGAMGLSLGLVYAPGVNSKTEELIALAKTVKKYDGIVAVHMRDEGAGVFDSLREMGCIARESGARVQISHIKLMYKDQWGRAQELIGLWQSLRAEGLNITCDQYPYCTGSTGLKTLVPQWAKKGTPEDLVALLKDDAMFEKMRPYLEAVFERHSGADHIGICDTCGVYPQLENSNILQVAEIFSLPAADTFRKLLVDTSGRARCLLDVMREDDVVDILSREDICIGSDGRGFGPGKEGLQGKPHPRSAGCFPRALRLCREKNLMPMEKMVRKMTGLTASILGLKDRGLVKEGYFADLAVFDPQNVTDTATPENPQSFARGVKYVLVNGTLALRDGQSTGSHAGRVICRERN